MEKANDHYSEAKAAYDCTDYKTALKYYRLAKGDYKKLHNEYASDGSGEKLTFRKRLEKTKEKIEEIKKKVQPYSSQMPFFAPQQPHRDDHNPTKTASEKSSFQPIP